MTCPPAESELLAARSLADLPDEVRAHVAGCPACAALAARLARLDTGVRAAAGVPDPAARWRTAAAVRRTRQMAAPGAWMRRAALVGLAAAVGFCFVGGVFTGRWWAPKPRPADHAPADLVRAPGGSAPFLARVAGPAAEVAADGSPRGQLDGLLRLAAEVRGEAARRVASGEADDVPRLSAAHDRLLKFGVLRQLGRLPAGDRPAAAGEVAAELGRAAVEVGRKADAAPPAAADLLRPFATSAAETAELVRAGRSPANDPPAWSEPPTLAEGLIAQTLRMADADEPVRRAEAAAALADTLARVVAVLAAGGLPDDAARVGASLDVVLARGVADNLDWAEATDPAGALRPEIGRVREQAGRAAEVLEQNLARAPAAARPGLERAMEASAPGRSAAKGGSKGAGPPWRREGAPPGKGVPPGWQKKN